MEEKIEKNKELHLSTICVHSDKDVEDVADVAPPIHLSTTYKYDHPQNPSLIYSREEIPTRKRVEKVIGEMEGGHAVCYSSGLAAIQAMINFYRPE